MYKGSKLELRSVEEVKQDIITAKMIADEIREGAWKMGYGDRVGVVARANGILWLDNGLVKNVFIGDSNSIIMKTEDLAQIISFLYQTFPRLERVTSYARAKTLVKKRADELKTLREAGLNRLHVGLETGYDELLEYVKKGATAEEMIIGGRKAIAAGFELSEYVMPGLGGKERWKQHAEETARVLNEINPHFIRLRTLGLAPNTPLHEKNRQGEFTLQSEEGLLIEVRTLIQNLEVTSQLVTSDFANNFYLPQIDDKLPENKDRMLRALDNALGRVQSSIRA
jgi:radical SAM superfamily enzyme YgiQ (UPF0313 family)